MNATTTTDTSTAPLLRELADRQEIADLVARLGVSLDEGRFDDLRSLLTEEATARTPGGEAAGRDAIVAQASRNHGPEHRVQHVITNVLVELAGDRADVRANLVVHFASPLTGEPGAEPGPPAALAPPVRFTLGEVYRFGVVRTPEGWRFSRVETIPVWMSGTAGAAPGRT